MIALIGIISLILYASFDQARAQTRDKARMTTLKELQLAIEQYKAQTGEYPSSGCGATITQFAGPGDGDSANGYEDCTPAESLSYIQDLIPDYVSVLPRDPRFEMDIKRGFYYRSNGYSYKLMAYNVVETLTIDSYDDEFARCPVAGGGCPNPIDDATARTYAVYSPGAADW